MDRTLMLANGCQRLLTLAVVFIITLCCVDASHRIGRLHRYGSRSAFMSLQTNDNIDMLIEDEIDIINKFLDVESQRHLLVPDETDTTRTVIKKVMNVISERQSMGAQDVHLEKKSIMKEFTTIVANITKEASQLTEDQWALHRLYVKLYQDLPRLVNVTSGSMDRGENFNRWLKEWRETMQYAPIAISMVGRLAHKVSKYNLEKQQADGASRFFSLDVSSICSLTSFLANKVGDFIGSSVIAPLMNGVGQGIGAALAGTPTKQETKIFINHNNNTYIYPGNMNSDSNRKMTPHPPPITIPTTAMPKPPPIQTPAPPPPPPPPPPAPSPTPQSHRVTVKPVLTRQKPAHWNESLCSEPDKMEFMTNGGKGELLSKVDQHQYKDMYIKWMRARDRSHGHDVTMMTPLVSKSEWSFIKKFPPKIKGGTKCCEDISDMERFKLVLYEEFKRSCWIFISMEELKFHQTSTTMRPAKPNQTQPVMRDYLVEMATDMAMARVQVSSVGLSDSQLDRCKGKTNVKNIYETYKMFMDQRSVMLDTIFSLKPNYDQQMGHDMDELYHYVPDIRMLKLLKALVLNYKSFTRPILEAFVSRNSNKKTDDTSKVWQLAGAKLLDNLPGILDTKAFKLDDTKDVDERLTAIGKFHEKLGSISRAVMGDKRFLKSLENTHGNVEIIQFMVQEKIDDIKEELNKQTQP